MTPYTKHTRHIDGYKVTVSCYQDTDMGPPWKEHDGHGPVSEWRCSGSKSPGERELYNDGRSSLFYDWREAVVIARRDGWGLRDEDKAALARKLGKPVESLTRGEIIDAAVLRDFERLRAWCNNEWFWVGYMTTIVAPDGEEIDGDSVWGWDSEDAMMDDAWGNAEFQVARLVETTQQTLIATCWP